MNHPNIYTVLIPILFLDDTIVLPYTHQDLTTEDRSAIAAADDAYRSGSYVLTVLNPETENPADALVGCLATVSEVTSMRINEHGATRIKLRGRMRCEIVSISEEKDFYAAEVVFRPDPANETDGDEEFLRRELLSTFLDLARNAQKEQDPKIERIQNAKSLSETVDRIASLALPRLRDRLDVLEEIDVKRRAELVIYKLGRDVRILMSELGIHHKVKERMDENQRQYYMREQIKVLQDELGEGDEGDEEIVEYMSRILKADLPATVTEKLVKEANKLAKMPYASAESTVIRGYLDAVLELPWNESSEDTIVIAKAREILDREHWGLQEVKDRILEFLSVEKLTDRQKSQILCLVGAPGVGKTSIASSIARAMNRKFVRVALGGVRDESDIRGHRKTYIGSMPGRIIHAVTEAGVKNPVILLDEIDKLTKDAHGDPSSALLEVLDPDQNKAFRDHFIELPFDLSDCFFIATANTLDTVSRPLLDRMEIIELKTYTRSEKCAIAKNHLIPKVLLKNGLVKRYVRIREDAIYEIIDHYTREAGVRNLERELSAVCRKIATRTVAEKEADPNAKMHITTVTAKDIVSYLGAPKVIDDPVLTEDEVGVVNGLAYTEIGGELLRVEAVAMPGTGKLELTGSLGDVMKESAKIAVSIARVRSEIYHLPSDFHKTRDIHVHFPEGAVPKDGPSAGVTLVTALISLLSGIPVRHDVAMTGEVTLSGRVLAIGGLREKTMAAYKSGIRTVLIPQDNLKDLARLEDYIKEEITFIPCRTVDDVLKHALTETPVGDSSVITPPYQSVTRSSYESEYRADNT